MVKRSHHLRSWQCGLKFCSYRSPGHLERHHLPALTKEGSGDRNHDLVRQVRSQWPNSWHNSVPWRGYEHGLCLSRPLVRSSRELKITVVRKKLADHCTGPIGVP